MRTLRTALLFVFALATLYAHGQQDSLHIRFIGTDTLRNTVKQQTTNGYDTNLCRLKTIYKVSHSETGNYTAVSGFKEYITGLLPKPSEIELYNNGKLVKGIYNRFYQINYAMSPDGYSVLVGYFLEDSLMKQPSLIILDTEGNQILQKDIDAKFFESQITVSDKAAFISIHPLKEQTNLYLFDNKGTEVYKSDNFNLWGYTKFYKNEYLFIKGKVLIVYDLAENKIANKLFEYPDFITYYEKDSLLVGSRVNSINRIKNQYSLSIFALKLNDTKKREEILLPDIFDEKIWMQTITITGYNQFKIKVNNINYIFELKSTK